MFVQAQGGEIGECSISPLLANFTHSVQIDPLPAFRRLKRWVFNLKPRRAHFSKILPFCPIDFATLEIERHEAPAIISRAFSFHGPLFANRFIRQLGFS
jgi:hypothetical protein